MTSYGLRAIGGFLLRVIGLTLNGYSNLCDIISAVFAPVGRAFQINRAKWSRNFDAVFFYVLRQCT